MIHKEEFLNYDLLSNYPFYFEDFQLPKEIVRFFKIKNYGNLPIKFERMSIEQNGCKGFGFEIRNCQPFSLAPNGHHVLEIAFSLDYSQKQSQKMLYLITKKEIIYFYLQVDLPFLASLGVKNKSDYDYFEFKIVEGVSIITILLFVISLFKSLKYKNFMKKKMRGEWKLVEASDVFELRDQNSVFSFENDIYELRKLRQAVKQTTNYSHSLLFEPTPGFDTPNLMEMSETTSNIEKKVNEKRMSLEEQGNQGKQELEFSDRKDMIEEGKEEKKTEKSKSKKEEKSKKSKTQEKKKNVKNTAAKPKKVKKEESVQENKEDQKEEKTKKEPENMEGNLINSYKISLKFNRKQKILKSKVLQNQLKIQWLWLNRRRKLK